ncbi:MAG: PTS sugar transporter subunit IIB [Bulleidia sp.]
MHSIDLGGAKMAEGCRQISKAIFISDQDAEEMKQLTAKGIRAEIQMVPDDSPEDVMKLL